MDRPTPHATYENRGLPALFFVAGAALLSTGLLILAIVTLARGHRDGYRLFIPVAMFAAYGAVIYLRSPTELSLAPGFIALRYPFVEPHWIPVSAIQGVIRHGRLGRTCEIKTRGEARTWIERLRVELEMKYFFEKSTGATLTDEALLAALPHLKVDNRFRNRFGRRWWDPGT